MEQGRPRASAWRGRASSSRTSRQTEAIRCERADVKSGLMPADEVRDNAPSHQRSCVAIATMAGSENQTLAMCCRPNKRSAICD